MKTTERQWQGSKLAAEVLAAAMTLLAPHAHAEGDYYFSPTDEKVRISLGVMHVKSSTTLQANSSAGASGTLLNGENDFGLDRSDFEPKFQATFRVDTRHRLSIGYFTLDRSGNTIVTDTPILFRNVLLIPGDPLQTNLSLRVLGLTYGYSFWHSEKLELAVTVGVQATDISTTARVQTVTRHIIQSEDAAGPIPTVGFDATWVISRRFYLDGRVQYLDVHVHDFDGSMGFYTLDALYRYRPNISFGVGFTETRVDLASLKTSDNARFDFDSRGPEMFFRVAF